MSATVNLKKHNFSKLSCNNRASLETIFIKKTVISHTVSTKRVHNVVVPFVIWYRPWRGSVRAETHM